MKDANARLGEPFAYDTLYKHAKRHMQPKIEEWRRLHGLQERTLAMKKKDRAKEILKETMEAVESPVQDQSEHVTALDEFIAAGRRKVDSGQMPITAQTYVQALKAKAEIENKTKDRRFDALKTLFSGAAPPAEDK